MIPIPKRKKTIFAVRCDECGRIFFFSRPRRTFTRFSIPGHGEGFACDGRRIRILHYQERRDALKRMGLE